MASQEQAACTHVERNTIVFSDGRKGTQNVIVFSDGTKELSDIVVTVTSGGDPTRVIYSKEPHYEDGVFGWSDLGNVTWEIEN